MAEANVRCPCGTSVDIQARDWTVQRRGGGRVRRPLTSWSNLGLSLPCPSHEAPPSPGVLVRIIDEFLFHQTRRDVVRVTITGNVWWLGHLHIQWWRQHAYAQVGLSLQADAKYFVKCIHASGFGQPLVFCLVIPRYKKRISIRGKGLASRQILHAYLLNLSKDWQCGGPSSGIELVSGEMLGNTGKCGWG